MNKAHQQLEIKTNARNAELEKVKVREVSTQTVSKITNMKQEESEASFEEKKKEIPCKDFHRIKGCRGGSKCWFFNDVNHKADKKVQN